MLLASFRISSSEKSFESSFFCIKEKEEFFEGKFF